MVMNAKRTPSKLDFLSRRNLVMLYSKKETGLGWDHSLWIAPNLRQGRGAKLECKQKGDLTLRFQYVLLHPSIPFIAWKRHEFAPNIRESILHSKRWGIFLKSWLLLRWESIFSFSLEFKTCPKTEEQVKADAMGDDEQ